MKKPSNNKRNDVPRPHHAVEPLDDEALARVIGGGGPATHSPQAIFCLGHICYDF